MKPVIIKFTDAEGKTTRTYSTTTIKTGVMDRIFDIAEKTDQYENGKLEMSDVRGFFQDLKAVMVDVFGRQFNYDDIDQGVDVEELINVFTAVCIGLQVQFGKNR